MTAGVAPNRRFFSDLEVPILQAPMAGAQGSALAIAVTGAGGLGALPCAMLSLDGIRRECAAIRAATRGPFNLNFFCHEPPIVDLEREVEWRRVLAPYYSEWGLDATAIDPGPARAAFDADAAALVEELRPAYVSFHFGLPAPDLLARVKNAGARVLSTATTVEEALWLEGRGVDAVIAQGIEAGGHRGIFLTDDLSTQAGTFALVRAILDRVSVPVVAAGGIADAARVAAALRSGATAVQIGTAYLLCPESTIGSVHREVISRERNGTAADDASTAITNLFSGRPARGIVNRLMREIGPMNEKAPAFPRASISLAPLRAKAEATGSGDFSPLWCGTNASGCRKIPASELTAMLAAEIGSSVR